MTEKRQLITTWQDIKLLFWTYVAVCADKSMDWTYNKAGITTFHKTSEKEVR